MIYVSDVEGDSDHRPHKFGKSASAETRAFGLLGLAQGTGWLRAISHQILGQTTAQEAH